MEIKEVEKLLSISRSNIRFYEKQGLLDPERGENNYRNYSDNDIAMLKKIIVLRKIGFGIEEISEMQKGKLLLSDAIDYNILRLEEEIEKLKGALETAKLLSSEKTEFYELDQDRYWETIVQAEKAGAEFIDICRDYLLFELNVFDTMWKFVFFHDFKKSRKKHGIWIASAILLGICILRGISKAVIWKESFWDGFQYPAILFLTVSILILPLYILSKKTPKAAAIIATILAISGTVFITFLIILIIVGLIMSIFN